MSGHAAARRTWLPVNQLASFEIAAAQAAEIRPGEIDRPRMRYGPGDNPAGCEALAEPTRSPTCTGPSGRLAKRGGVPVLTPRLIAVLAAMVDAVLDAENSLSATRGTVATRRPRMLRDRTPASAKRDAKEVHR